MIYFYVSKFNLTYNLFISESQRIDLYAPMSLVSIYLKWYLRLIFWHYGLCHRSLPTYAIQVQQVWIWQQSKKCAMMLLPQKSNPPSPLEHHDTFFFSSSPLSIWQSSLHGDVRSSCHATRTASLPFLLFFRPSCIF